MLNKEVVKYMQVVYKNVEEVPPTRKCAPGFFQKVSLSCALIEELLINPTSSPLVRQPIQVKVQGLVQCNGYG